MAMGVVGGEESVVAAAARAGMAVLAPRTRVFVTGATGHVGQAVARAFRARGYQVLALARSARAAAWLAEQGCTVVPGQLADARFAAVAATCDVVVHTAFEYTAAGEERRDIDAAAAAAILDAQAAAAARDERPRQFIYTSNACLLRSVGGEPVDEDVDPAAPEIPPSWRFAVERRVLRGPEAALRSGDAAPEGPAAPSAVDEAGARLVRTAVVRLGIVYGGAGGSTPSLFRAAVRHGAGVYPLAADSSHAPSRLAFVHRDDAAALYLRVAECGAGGVYHAVDGALLSARAVAEAVSHAAGLGGGVVGLPCEAAIEALGAHTVGVLRRDLAVLNTRARALGWRPTIASFAAGAASAYGEWASARADL